jgi:hypothetical protein
MRKALPDPSFGEPLTSVKVRRLFDEVKPGLADAAIRDMEKLDLISTDGELSRDAAMMLRIELKRI